MNPHPSGMILAAICVGLSVALAQPVPYEAGCSDGTREWFSPASTWPNIAGCRGRFLLPGVTSSTAPSCNRRAGNNGLNSAGSGCTAADLCAPGWHVCRSHVEVRVLYGGTDPCDSVTGVFFATAQSFTDNSYCKVSYSGTDDLFGCADRGFGYSASNCGVLNRAISTTSCPSGWSCGSNTKAEALNVFNGGDQGGVLCCKDEPVCESTPGSYCATSGCSDDARNNFLSTSTHKYISGCSGSWNVPGIRVAGTMINSPTCSRNAGDLSGNSNGIGCRAADLCPEGWEICESDLEVSMWSGTSFCDSSGVSGNAFFATGQRSSRSACSSSGIAEGMIGCGSDTIGETLNCQSLNKYSGEACSSSSTGGVWSCIDNAELSTVTKSDSSNGGVLCCQRRFAATSLCPVGTVSSGNATECSVCSPGRYSDSPGQSSCKLCTAGRYSEDSRSSSCLECASGTFSGDGASRCSAAPSASPTESPTQSPTQSPTVTPTTVPTPAPTLVPTMVPTKSPTLSPTSVPPSSTQSTSSPTLAPTRAPTTPPTLSPVYVTTSAAPSPTPAPSDNGPGTFSPTNSPSTSESPSETEPPGQSEPTPPPSASAAASRDLSGFPRAAIIAVAVLLPSLLVLCLFIGYRRYKVKKDLNSTTKIDKYLLEEKPSFIATDTGEYRKYTHL